MGLGWGLRGWARCGGEMLVCVSPSPFLALHLHILCLPLSVMFRRVLFCRTSPSLPHSFFSLLPSLSPSPLLPSRPPSLLPLFPSYPPSLRSASPSAPPSGLHAAVERLSWQLYDSNFHFFFHLIKEYPSPEGKIMPSLRLR